MGMIWSWGLPQTPKAGQSQAIDWCYGYRVEPHLQFFFYTSPLLACKFFWKQLEQLVKTTSSFSPRNCAAILKPGAVAPG
jgi:hypothetical protein